MRIERHRATLDTLGKSRDYFWQETSKMATYHDFADGYVKRIRGGARAEDIAKEINALVYEGTQTPLSADHKAYLAGLIKARFESLHGTAVPGQPGVVYIRDSDNRAYLALVAQMYALLGIK